MGNKIVENKNMYYLKNVNKLNKKNKFFKLQVMSDIKT